MGRIYMHFYTGSLKSSDPLFLYYGRKDSEKAGGMINILEEFQRQEKKDMQKLPEALKKSINLICQCRFKKAYKTNGIKCYSSYDAF